MTNQDKHNRFSGPKGGETLPFAPRYDQNGLIPAIAVEASSGQILMLAYMNAKSLGLTLETGEVHYWSRSRKEIWHKGATSGQVQKLVGIKLDCDQDTILLEVEPQGDGKACHLGPKSCFHNRLLLDKPDQLVKDSDI